MRLGLRLLQLPLQQQLPRLHLAQQRLPPLGFSFSALQLLLPLLAAGLRQLPLQLSNLRGG